MVTWLISGVSLDPTASLALVLASRGAGLLCLVVCRSRRRSVEVGEGRGEGVGRG